MSQDIDELFAPAPERVGKELRAKLRVAAAQDEADSLDFAELDLTSQEVDFTEIDELMAKFAEDDRIQEALSKGIDMRAYSQNVENELDDLEHASLLDYMREAPRLAELHEQISACDGILETMETMLSGFQNDLGDISEEIKALQEKSSSMSIKLRNRKAVGAQLTSFIDDALVSPELVKRLFRAEVNEKYVGYLRELDKKIQYVQSLDAEQVKAVGDVRPQLTKLRIRAVAKIREFLLTHINQTLRRPKTNVQVLQQTVMIKFRFFNRFLQLYARDTSDEIQKAYVETVGAIFYNYIRNYVQSILKIQKEVATKDDLIATGESMFGGGRFLKSIFSSNAYASNRASVFSLVLSGENTNRARVLEKIDSPSLLPHVEAEKGNTFAFEEIYRSMLNYILNTVTSEYVFGMKFFGPSNQLFAPIFERTLANFLEHIRSYMDGTFDLLGVLLVLRLTQEYAHRMHERKITVLDKTFFNEIQDSAWGRAKELFALNVESVQQAAPDSLGSVSNNPHYVTRRFGELAASVLTLNAGLGDKRLYDWLARLRRQWMRLLERLARTLKTGRDRRVFLINNYDLALSIMQERAPSSPEVDEVGQLLENASTNFVEFELGRYYGKLIAFVQKIEPQILDKSSPVPTLNKEEVQELVTHFNRTWKDVLKELKDTVLHQFSNLLNGVQLMQQAVSQLVLYYTRFHTILKDCGVAATWANQLVPLPTLTYEIKKLTSVLS